MPAPDAPSHAEQAILDELTGYLAAQGLLRVPFTGWSSLPTPPTLPALGVRWYRARIVWFQLDPLPPLPPPSWYRDD